MFRLIDKDTPLFSNELIAPWRLASLGVGLALLILGSVFLPSDDWDVPVCLVMGLPAYVLAPWAFRPANFFYCTMCTKPQVEKIRYRIPAAEQGLVWEVDEFLGENAPLITAEIELPSESTSFSKPDWVGDDVTEDHRYKNNNLAANPYANWRTDRDEAP